VYTEWLRLSNPETGGKADLAAFFFRAYPSRPVARQAMIPHTRCSSPI
jgi:hypothetical protein